MWESGWRLGQILSHQGVVLRWHCGRKPPKILVSNRLKLFWAASQRFHILELGEEEEEEKSSFLFDATKNDVCSCFGPVEIGWLTELDLFPQQTRRGRPSHFTSLGTPWTKCQPSYFGTRLISPTLHHVYTEVTWPPSQSVSQVYGCLDQAGSWRAVKAVKDAKAKRVLLWGLELFCVKDQIETCSGSVTVSLLIPTNASSSLLNNTFPPSITAFLRYVHYFNSRLGWEGAGREGMLASFSMQAGLWQNTLLESYIYIPGHCSALLCISCYSMPCPPVPCSWYALLLLLLLLICLPTLHFSSRHCCSTSFFASSTVLKILLCSNIISRNCENVQLCSSGVHVSVIRETWEGVQLHERNCAVLLCALEVVQILQLCSWVVVQPAVSSVT